MSPTQQTLLEDEDEDEEREGGGGVYKVISYRTWGSLTREYTSLR